MEFVVEIQSYNWVSHYINDINSLRHNLILELHHNGYTNVEIRDFLNINKVKPPRTSHYTTKLVWGTIKKLLDRKERDSEVKITTSEVMIRVSNKTYNPYL